MDPTTILYVIDHEYNILYRNPAFMQLYPEIRCGQRCYEALGHRETICVHCPVQKNKKKNTFYNTTTGEWVQAQAAKIEWEDRTDCYALLCKIWKDIDQNTIKYKEKENQEMIDALIAASSQMSQDMRRVQEGLQKENAILSEQNYDLLFALSREYGNVYFVDLDQNNFEVYRMNNFVPISVQKAIKESKKYYDYCISAYIEENVYKSDQPMMTNALSAKNIKEELKHKDYFVCNYRVLRNQEIIYYQVKCIRLSENVDSSKVILGFRDVDEEVRKEFNQRQILADALEHAEHANRAKTIFLNNVSHDIRTPMNAIVGFTELAQSHLNDTEKIKDYLQKIEQSSKHLLSLINDVLDMSWIESGKMHLEYNSENLIDIMNNLKNIIQSDLDRKQLKLEMDMDKVHNKDIICDKLRLNQVLLNLASNAIKFTNPGGMIKIRITQHSISRPGYAVYEIRVKDTGIGMSKEFTEHLFEPFVRERSYMVREIQGTGLGMPITKSLVDMNGGTISVESEIGKGTEFIVTLTFRLQTKPKEIEEVETVKEYNLQGKRILLAEDNELNREIAVTLLEEAGVNVDTAENGKIAYDLIRSSNPGYYDLVLMDIQMPVMNGYEAARRIRRLEDEQLSQIPVIAMTANAFEEDKRIALKNGMNGHIAKPIDREQLIRSIAEWIGE
jgi:signal transduction histidine kinase/ActR/RegA family two-component response regulator